MKTRDLTSLIDGELDDGDDRILREQFYGRRARPPGRERPTHYKIVCISLYTEDISRLEEKVADLKRRGHTRASKSALIRYALDNVDLEKMPKDY